MKCIECGHELKDGAIFCIRCGAMQVSMDGSRLEEREWPTVEPAADGSAWRAAESGRPSASGQHSRDFTPAPQRGGGRIAAIVIAIVVVLVIVLFALFNCMGPATSEVDATSSSAASSESASGSSSAASDSSASASSSAASDSSASASASSASASAAAVDASASAASASGDNQSAEPTPTIVGEQPQTQTQSQAPAQSQSQSQPAQSQQQAPAATPAPSAPAPTGGDYVLAESSSRAYSQSELEAYSTSDLYYARNEIFARHGRMFQRTDLQNYFNSKSWYNPQYTPEQWNNLPNQLNEAEIANANLIMQVEKAKGSPYL